MQSGFTHNLRRLKRRSLIGQLVLWLLGAEILFFASFTAVPLPTATSHNLRNFGNDVTADYLQRLPEPWQARVTSQFPQLNQIQTAEVRFTPYIPLVPIAIFIGYAFGLPLAVCSTVTYFLLGFVGPRLQIFPFAAGGGMHYWQEPSFGYLIGIVAASWIVGKLCPEDRTSWRQLAAIAAGVLSVHLLGLFYLVGSSLLVLLVDGEAAYLEWQPFLSEQIRNLSWYPLPYDLIFSLILIGAGFPVRWLVSTLTSPDIAFRGKGRVESQLLTETTV